MADTPKPAQGAWTLIAPDGKRSWQAEAHDAAGLQRIFDMAMEEAYLHGGPMLQELLADDGKNWLAIQDARDNLCGPRGPKMRRRLNSDGNGGFCITTELADGGKASG